jgi:hypothetical protein
VSLMKRREISILGILGVVLYAFIYVKFVYLPALPVIEEKNVKIAGLQKQKDSLDSDMANLEAKKADYGSKLLNNERMGEYLMETASVADGLEYVEKISGIIEKEISSINVNAPKEINLAGPQPAGTDGAAAATPLKYYELKIDFQATLNYNEAMELVKYCEGGTRKVRISNFRLSAAPNTVQTPPVQQPAPTDRAGQTPPATQPPAAQAPVPQAPAAPPAQSNAFIMASGTDKYAISMSVCFYSLNKGNLDTLYDYSRSRFQKFRNAEGVPFIQQKTDSGGNVVLPDIASSDTGSGGGADGGTGLTLATADLVIKEAGYLVGGENFEMFANADVNKRVRIKTKEHINISLSLNGDNYTVDAMRNGGAAQTLSGRLSSKAFSIYVDSEVPYAKENENIGMSIRISNSSGRSVNVAMAQRTGRVKLLDRNGGEIYVKSDSEKVYVV